MLHAKDQSDLSSQSPTGQRRKFKMAEPKIAEVRTPKRKRAWKDGEVKILIEKYEKRLCLRDTFNKDYHNNDKKLIALAEIEESLGMLKDEFAA